ncbi:MAG: hypothetical protein EAX91_04665 [Candidatus Lokiarchaeota archaeon]|nr:hypothetical protein [Candidatus Lokiarchaeota archaeon]
MDWIKLAKIKNYLSNRIDEIKEGSYVPSYKQIKALPEFKGVSEETFNVARKEWYLRHFGMRAKKFTAHLKLIKEGNLSELVRNNYMTQLEETKPQYISEKEYTEYAIKKLKKDVYNGLCFLIPGVLLLANALVVMIVLHWDWNYIGGYVQLASIIMCIGLFAMGIGILVMIHPRIKARKLENDLMKL